MLYNREPTTYKVVETINKRLLITFMKWILRFIATLKTLKSI